MRSTRSRVSCVMVTACLVALGLALPAGAAMTSSHSSRSPFSSRHQLTSISPHSGAPTSSASGQVAPTGPSSLAHSRVIVQLQDQTVTFGQGLVVTASVRPRAPGRLVTLQRQETGRWRNVARARTNSSGSAVFRFTAGVVGEFRIRALVLATAVYAPATSRSWLGDVAPLPPVYAGAPLQEGDSGSRVLSLQQRLSELGYWVGSPNGSFGDATQQAVFALQKAAGLSPNGVVGQTTVTALSSGVVPKPRSTSGQVIEVDLHRDLVMFVNDGKLAHVLNTSSGGGYTYVESGVSSVATTPVGIFHINRVVDGFVTDPLGTLWRPRFFYEGFAIHGDSYVPANPVSHGCVRVSNEAIDWIWADGLAPIGTEVWVY